VGLGTHGTYAPCQGTHNNKSERAVKPIAIGRKNWMFAGNNNAGRTAAILYSFVDTCKRHKIDPWLYLNDVLTRINDLKMTELHTLLPDVWQNQTPINRAAAA